VIKGAEIKKKKQNQKVDSRTKSKVLERKCAFYFLKSGGGGV
jgi:hypothetical protein